MHFNASCQVDERVFKPGSADFETAHRELQKQIALGEWVTKLAPWDVKMDLTWRHERGVSEDSAKRAVEKFFALEYPRLSYLYAIEENPSRDGHHVHGMVAEAMNVYRKEMWKKWFDRHGRALIEPIRDREHAVDYCSKYVFKKDGWWDVKLQWHHKQALNDATFILKDDKGRIGG